MSKETVFKMSRYAEVAISMYANEKRPLTMLPFQRTEGCGGAEKDGVSSRFITTGRKALKIK